MIAFEIALSNQRKIHVHVYVMTDKMIASQTSHTFVTSVKLTEVQLKTTRIIKPTIVAMHDPHSLVQCGI